MDSDSKPSKLKSLSFNWYAFPYPVLILFAYLCAGSFFDAWHPAWLIFLTIPIYYIMVAVSRAKTFSRKAYIFPYHILCLIFFLTVGFDYDLWHPAWLIFLTIPIYYMMIASINAKNFKSKANRFPFPIICLMLYLIIGFAFDLWHPGWMLTFTIPTYYMLVNAVKWYK